MSISKFFRLLFGITATGMIAACSVTGKMDRLEYFYNQDQRQRNLVMKVPAGYLQERIERLDNGIQVRSFEYPGGAKLYLACRDLASEPTVLLDAQPGADQRLFSRFGATGTGTKPDGRHWGRIYSAGFLIGFDSVSAKELQTYDQAIRSVRVKH